MGKKLRNCLKLCAHLILPRKRWLSACRLVYLNPVATHLSIGYRLTKSRRPPMSRRDQPSLMQVRQEQERLSARLTSLLIQSQLPVVQKSTGELSKPNVERVQTKNS